MKSFTASLFKYASRMSEAERTSPSARSAGHGDDESRDLAENEVRDPNDEGDHVQETGSLHGDNGGDDGGGEDGGGQEHDDDYDNDGSGGGGGDRSDDENDDQVPADGIEDRLRGLDAVHAAIALMRKGVKELDLADRGIGDEDAEVLGEELGKNASLVSLNLFNNIIHEQGGIAIGKGLSKNKTLTSLNLGGNWWEDRNAIGPTGAVAIAEALTMGCPLKILNLDSNMVKAKGGSALGKALGKSSLEELILHNNSVGDEGAAEIGRGLRETKSLKLLNLHSNKVGDDGAVALGEGLGKNKSLTLITLQWNNIGPAGGQSLGEGLGKHKSLTSFNVSYNKIGSKGAAAVGKGLGKSSSLTFMTLQSNRIGDSGAIGLGKGVSKNRSLKELILEDNNIGESGTIALGDALSNNSSLDSLVLRGNKIGDKGAVGLGKGLCKNSSLTSLVLGGNKINCEGIASLAELVLTENDTLVQVLGLPEDYLDSMWRAVLSAPKGEARMERIRDYLFDSESDAWTLNAHVMAQKSAHVFAVLMFNLDEKDTKVQSLLSDPSFWLQEAVECDGVEATTGLPLIHALFACHVSNEFALPGKFCDLFDHWVRLEDGLLMMDAKDSGGRSLQPLAFANSNTSDWARSYGTYLKRFRIAEGPPVHESKTCAVHFGTDIETENPVALKIMRVKEQYEREKDARDADGMAVDGCMSILYRDDAKLAEALDKDLCLVMSQASRSLFEAINTERFAGRDLPKIRMIAYKVICVIQNLHNSGRIHGDIKPRNVVRVNASKQHTFKDAAKGGQFEVSKAWKDDSAGELFDAADEEDWQLIDLDASAEISSAEHPNERKLLTGKMSTGYVAPEVARWEFRDGTEGEVAPEAVPAIDVWGFGVVLFQLLSGTKLFMVDESDDNIIANGDKTELMNWLALDNERLHRIQKREDKNERKDKGKTGKSKADGLTATDFEIEAARDLVRLCLRGDPSERISVDQIVEHHPFFDVERLNARHSNKDQDDPNGDREDSNEDQDDANEDQDDEDQEDDVNEGQGNDSNEDQDYDSGNSPRRSNTQENPRFSERVMGLHRLVVPTRFSLFGRTTAPPLANDSHTSKFYAASAHNELIELPAFHFFLSHMQAQAAGTVKDLLMGLERNEMTAWVDMRASEITLKSMQRGVLSSQRFIMVLTTDVLFRPFCLAELKFAIDRFSKLEGGVTKYISFVVEGDSRFSAWDEDRDVPWNPSIKASDIEKLKEGLASLDLDPEEVLRDAENTVRECSKIPYRRRMYEEEAMLRALARHAGFRAVPLPPSQSSELRLCIVSKQSSPIANELKKLLQDAGANLCKIEKAPVVLVVLEPKCQADVNAALDAAPANVPLLAVHHAWKFADDRKDLKPEWQTKLLDELEVLPWRAKTNKENATYLVDHEQPALISELCLRVRRALRASALDS